MNVELSETNSSSGSDILLNYHNYKKNSYDSRDSRNSESNLQCNICNIDKNDTFVILSCNHIYHTNCFVENQFNNIYKYNTIDSVYLNSRECLKCKKNISLEELMFAHSKYISKIKNILETHSQNISCLENKLKNINDELKACYDYKHKLEIDKEKSKNIIDNLMVMI